MNNNNHQYTELERRSDELDALEPSDDELIEIDVATAILAAAENGDSLDPVLERTGEATRNAIQKISGRLARL